MGGLAKLLIVVVFVLGGAAAALLYGEDAEPGPPPPPPSVQVRKAAGDLTVGAFLDADDAPYQTMPLSELRDGWITDGGPDVIGAIVIAPVAAGAPVPRAALLTPGQEGFLAAALKPGMRAVSVGVDAVSGNAGLIFPGDRVDVLLTQRLDGAGDDDPALRWGSETILRNVRVIAVDQNFKTDLSARDASQVARTVTFEVSPHEAEMVAVARNLGALSLTLRSLIVEGAPETDGAVPPPTWAGDVSAVVRAAAGRGLAAREPMLGGELPIAPAGDFPLPAQAGAAPVETPAARRVVVLRGRDVSEVEEAQP